MKQEGSGGGGAGPAPDCVAANLEQLRRLFPMVVREDAAGPAVDLAAFRQLVGDRLLDEPAEPYGLTWPGKRAARQRALAAGTATLRPRPEESRSWESTQNLLIEGDNLEALALLRSSLAGRVGLILIDPPYNTGQGFVYRDRHPGEPPRGRSRAGRSPAGAAGRDAAAVAGQRHGPWLSLMYPRLLLARELLAPDGILLAHIDEHEAPSLVLLLREIFGEDQELGVCVWDKRNPKGDARGIAYQHESIVCFARDAPRLFATNPLKRPKRNGVRMLQAAREAVSQAASPAEAAARYLRWLRSQPDLTGGEQRYCHLTPEGRVYRLVSMAWPNKKRAPAAYFEPLVHPRTGRPCPVPARGWRNPPATMQELLHAGLIEFGPDETVQPQRKYYLDENLDENIPSILPFGGSDDRLLEELGVPFDQPKPVALTAALVGWCLPRPGTVLDFFAGSGTTGHAVMLQNAADGIARRFVLVQLPEPLDPGSPSQEAAARFCDLLGRPRTIAELTKERLRRAADGVRAAHPAGAGDLGFRVFQLTPTTGREPDPQPEHLAGQGTLDLAARESDLDLLAALLLELGLDLGEPIRERTIAGQRVVAVGRGRLLACFAPEISRADTVLLGPGLVAWRAELAPAGETTCAFRDIAFVDEATRADLTAFLQQHGVASVRSL